MLHKPDRQTKAKLCQKPPKKDFLDFGSLGGKSEGEKGAGSEKKALPALDSGSRRDRIGQTGQPGGNIPPVVGGCGTKGSKFGLVPQFRAVGTPERGEGPAFRTRPPTRRGGGPLHNPQVR